MDDEDIEIKITYGIVHSAAFFLAMHEAEMAKPEPSQRSATSHLWVGLTSTLGNALQIADELGFGTEARSYVRDVFPELPAELLPPRSPDAPTADILPFSGRRGRPA